MIKKRLSVLLGTVVILAAVLTGCGNNVTERMPASLSGEEAVAEETIAEEPVVEEGENAKESIDVSDDGIELEDGTYIADFETDSSMFHVNEIWDGQAIMTVQDKRASIHIVLTSKNIVNLFPGLAEDAEKDGAVLLEPVIEEVTYDDGMTEEVNAFDVPVPYLNEEFDLALIGTKAKWYDHKVKVSNPLPYDGEAEKINEAKADESEVGDTINVSLEGGSGKATIESPAKLAKIDDGYLVTIIWSSPYYDYMIVDGQKLEPINTEGNSTFELPVSDLGSPLEVIADTVAMSKPHEIEYVITFDVK